MPASSDKISLAEVGSFDSGDTEFPDIEVDPKTLLWERRGHDPRPFIGLQGGVRTPVDLGENYYFPPVGHQKETEACSAFALAGLIEFYQFQIFGRTDALSIGWMHSCVGGEGLDDAVAFDALAFALKGRDIPIVTETYPWSNTKCERTGKVAMPTLTAKSSDDYSPQFIQRVLQSGRPIVTSLLVNEDFKEWMEWDPYNYNPDIDYYEHTIIVVGYDENTWICRNSFGSSWGEKGRFRVKYGDCDLCTGFNRVFTFAEPEPLEFV